MKIMFKNWEIETDYIKDYCVACNGEFNETEEEAINRYHDCGNYCRPCGGRIVRMARIRVLVGGTEMRLRNYPKRNESSSYEFISKLLQSYKKDLNEAIKTCPWYTDLEFDGRLINN